MVFLETIGFLFVEAANSILAIMNSFPPITPPLSSIFILIVAFIISLGSALVSRYMIDVDRLAVLTRETKKYNKLKMEAVRKADTKLKLKVDRLAEKNKKLQSELTMMRMKPLLITFIPLMLVFFAMAGIYRGAASSYTPGDPIPAVIPFWLPPSLLLRIGQNTYVPGWGDVFLPDYIWWYFGGSITFGSIFQKVLGLQPD